MLNFKKANEIIESIEKECEDKIRNNYSILQINTVKQINNIKQEYNDMVQVKIVQKVYDLIQDSYNDLAYNVANEAYNWKLIPSYKYLELMKILNRTGEFEEYAKYFLNR